MSVLRICLKNAYLELSEIRVKKTYFTKDNEGILKSQQEAKSPPHFVFIVFVMYKLREHTSVPKQK